MRSSTFATVLLASTALSPLALAQETTDESTTRDEIVVTVERREQSLQDLAGTATVFDGAELKSLGVQSVADLNGRYPGLQIGNNQGNIEVYIRGVGSSNNTELGEPAAATHLNGVYVPRPSGFGSTFFDIQRVEVNVGPQGTLRGRNATAGSVDIIPFKPGLGVFDAMIEAGYGAYDEYSLEGMVNIPVTENSALRIAGFYLNHDSYYENVNPTSDVLGVSVPTAESEGVGVAEAADNWGMRATYLVELSDRFTFTLTGDYLAENGSGYTGTNYANPLGNGVAPSEIDNPRKVVGRAFTPVQDVDHWGIKGHLQYEGDWFNAEYIGSYRDLVYDYRAATPLSPAYPGVYDNLGNLEEALNNFSFFQSVNDSESQVHELRFFNETESGIVWNTGVFFFKEDQRTFLGATGDRTLFFSGIEFNQRTETDSWAVYGDATYPVTDRFRLTGGVRYTSEEKQRTGVNARYGFAIGGAGYNCCGGVRVGSEGFAFSVFDRTILNPDINGDGVTSDQEVLDFYFDGIKSLGNQDNVGLIFANGPLVGVDLGNPGQIASYPDCIDTISGDFWECPSTTDGIGFDDAAAGKITYALPFQGQIAPQNGFASFSFIDWRVRGEFDITPDNLAYFSVSTGHSSGGFNDNLPNVNNITFTPSGGTPAPFDTTELAPTFGEEKVIVYELGSKNEFDTAWGGAYVNASVFYYDYQDLIQNVLLSIGQILNEEGLNTDAADPAQLALVVNFNFNASDAEIYGAQFEGGFDLPWNMRIDGNLLWLPEARIKKSELIADSRFQADVSPAEAIPQSIDGFRLRRTPRVSLNTSLSQKFDVPTGSADWIVSLGWRSSQNQDLFNGVDYQNPDNPRLRLDDLVEGYATIDAGVGYSHGDSDKLRFEAYVTNLTNQQREQAIIITQFDNTRFFTRPRTYGVRVRAKF